MSNEKGASKEKRVVRLLLLYQGEKAEELADGIIVPLEKDWAGDIGCVCDALKFGEAYAQMDLWHEYTKRVAWADAAVAILAVDTRAASLVGNVWFEIGWWIAKKPYKTLLICVQDHPKVAAISDFEGRKAPRFSSPEELLKEIRKHVAFVASMKSASREAGGKRYDQNGRYLDASKLKDTLGCDKWNQQGVHTCEHLILRLSNASSDGENESQTLECDFRKQSTGFISELLRMARAGRECTEIQEAFQHFAVSASLALATDKQPIDKDNKSRDENRRDEARCKHLDDMVLRLRKLGNLVKELVLPRKKYYHPVAEDEWEKLRYFIEYRLDMPWEQSYGMKVPQDLLLAVQGMKSMAEPFTDWARRLIQDGVSKNPYYLQHRGASDASTEEANRIREYKRLAETMGELLDHIGCEYFRLCRQSMKDIFCARNPFADLRHTLSALRSNLPHNKEGYAFPHIWPEKWGKG